MKLFNTETVPGCDYCTNTKYKTSLRIISLNIHVKTTKGGHRIYHGHIIVCINQDIKIRLVIPNYCVIEFDISI